MISLRIMLCSVVLLLLNHAFAQGAGPSFAVGSTVIWDQMQKAPSLTINSPDGKKTIVTSFQSNHSTNVYDERHLQLQVQVGNRIFTVNAGRGVGSEVMWAPDSQAFFLTTSDEGLTGWFHTLIYFVTSHGLKKVNIHQKIERAFGRPVKCGSPEFPNIVGVRWIGSSKHLLVAAQIIPHTNCDSNGIFKTYDVLLPDIKIIHQYGQLETKKRFGEYLGAMLRGAPDECITNPRSCEVPFNHRVAIQSH